MFNRKEYNNNYHKKHKKLISKRKKSYYQNNKEQLRMIGRKKRLQNLKSWEDFLPKKTQCQICGKKVYFNNGNVRKAINFDHRKESIKIKINPTAWLANHNRILKRGNLKNQKIWENCDFGILCQRCNTFLPTKNRKEFLRKAVSYVFRKEILIDEKA